jgi:hypothetical protein
MTGRAIRRYQMLVRVRAFGAKYADRFPSGTAGVRMFVAVGEAVSALEQHAVVQTSARGHGAVYAKNAARTRLRKVLRVISRTARGVAVGAPALAGAFRVPKTNGDHALLMAARAFAHDAREHNEAFIEHGLPPAFLDDLDVAITALEHESRGYNAARQAGVAAAAGIDVALGQALTSVRRLDAIVANLCREDPGAMAAWQSARRVGRKRRAGAPDVAIPCSLRVVGSVARY